MRKVTNNKRVFPSDNAVFKSLYLAIDYMTKKWTMPIQNWNEAMAHLMIKFEEYMFGKLILGSVDKILC